MTALSVDFLRSVSLFEDLEEEALERLAGLFQERAYSHEETLFRDGDPAEALFVVRQGSVAIFTDTVGKPVYLLARIQPGEFFGELGLLNDSPRSASARAEEGSRILQIHKEALMGFLAQHPEVELKLRLAASQRHAANVAAALELGRRKEVRIRVNRAVVVQVEGGGTATAHLENLSLGGAHFSQAPPAWQPGRRLTFAVSVEEGAPLLQLEGRVEWRQRDQVGVAFEQSSADHDFLIYQTLRRLLDSD